MSKVQVRASLGCGTWASGADEGVRPTAAGEQRFVQLQQMAKVQIGAELRRRVARCKRFRKLQKRIPICILISRVLYSKTFATTMSVTIKDVARESGVNVSTVSRALNGEY